MAKVPRSAYVKAFQARLKHAREGADMSQAAMAKALGIGVKTYAKYESRPGSLLPLPLLPVVCHLTGFDPWYLMTGEAPIRSPRDLPDSPAPTAARRRRN